MKSSKSTKNPQVSTIRMKDIVAQLADIVYLLCYVRGDYTYTLLKQCTNITDEELDSLNIFYPQYWSNLY